MADEIVMKGGATQEDQSQQPQGDPDRRSQRRGAHPWSQYTSTRGRAQVLPPLLEGPRDFLPGAFGKKRRIDGAEIISKSQGGRAQLACH